MKKIWDFFVKVSLPWYLWKAIYLRKMFALGERSLGKG